MSALFNCCTAHFRSAAGSDRKKFTIRWHINHPGFGSAEESRRLFKYDSNHL